MQRDEKRFQELLVLIPQAVDRSKSDALVAEFEELCAAIGSERFEELSARYGHCY